MTALVQEQKPAVSTKASRLPLELAALGVVFGDIGTSPLYAFDLALRCASGVPLELAVLGVVSLIAWTLLIIVTVKYVVFVLDADNHGEGGILALITRMRLHRSDRPADKILLAAGLCGGALGVLLAQAGLSVLVWLAPSGLPRLDDIGINGWVLLFTLAISLLAGLMFGLVPVLRFGEPSVTALKEGGRSASDGPTRHRARSALVVTKKSSPHLSRTRARHGSELAP